MISFIRMAVASSLLFTASVESLAFTKSGGRAPLLPNNVQADKQAPWAAKPSAEEEAKLIVLQVTDVYTLENFAHFKTLLEDTRQKAKGAKVVCMLTGDFLSPYLLSSVDKGAGMMKALASVPMDYLTWGNHEADIDHDTVCSHVRNFNGKWINSNMLDHEAMDCQQEYDVVEIASPDGSNTRKVGLCAVLSDDPMLYSHFKAPGAFGGATITDPWKTLKKYSKILTQDEGCDMVLPLQHLYVPDDHKTCQDFDFPVILSGHDHHRVDEIVEGTRLIKPGMNAEYSTVLEISWPNGKAEQPVIESRFVKCSDWEADPVCAEENERAYDALEPMRNTELAQVPSKFEPLSSMGARESVCTMGQFICSLLKKAMNENDDYPSMPYDIDAVLLMGGNIRGNKDYEKGEYFSLEALEAEIKADEVVGVVPMPGWLLAEGIQATHAGEPISGWFQFDDGVVEDTTVSPPVITHVNGKPIDLFKFYRVATKISDLTNGQSPPMKKYYEENPHLLPTKGNYINMQSELMGSFAQHLWEKLFNAVKDEVEEECGSTCGPEDYLEYLDQTGDGEVSVEDIQVALEDLLEYSVDERETTLAEEVLAVADISGNGSVTIQDLQLHCFEMEKELEKLDEFGSDTPELTVGGGSVTI